MEVQKKLEDFKNVLQEAAILLAKNLLNEGATTLSFSDSDPDVSGRTPLSNEQVQNMSFEDFAAHLAFSPAGGIPIDQFSNGRHRGGRITSISTNSPLSPKYSIPPQSPHFKLEKSQTLQSLPSFDDDTSPINSPDVQSEDDSIIEKLEEKDKTEDFKINGKIIEIDFQSSSDEPKNNFDKIRLKTRKKRSKRTKIPKSKSSSDNRTKPYRSNTRGKKKSLSPSKLSKSESVN